MPSKHVIRDHLPQAYYHVYNRGVEKRTVFLDVQDYTVFIGLLKKHLTGKAVEGSNNRHKVESLADEVKLLAYCLMPNHYHLLLYQISEQGITKLMRRVATGYSMYFNNRYNRVGSLFQGRFKASNIANDPYLYHISRYIHLNPDDYATYPYSSLKYYISPNEAPVWLDTSIILEYFNNSLEEYIKFVDEYQMSDQETKVLAQKLANASDLDESDSSTYQQAI